MELTLKNSIEHPLTDMKPIRIGCVPSSLPTPNKFAVLEKDDSPELRIDIYFDREDDNFYCDGLILDQSIFIAFGNRVFCLSLDGKEIHALDLMGDFVSIKNWEEHIYISSTRNLFKLDKNGKMLWSSKDIGIDGVEIISIMDKTILVSATNDPQESIIKCSIDAASGHILSTEEFKLK